MRQARGERNDKKEKLVNLARRHRSSTPARTATVKVIIQCSLETDCMKPTTTTSYLPPSPPLRSLRAKNNQLFQDCHTLFPLPGGKFRAKFHARHGDNFRFSSEGSEKGGEGAGRGPHVVVLRIWRMALCPCSMLHAPLTNDALMK